MFSGRRWVAPKVLRAYRYPADSAIAQPLDAGKYISIYWLTDGRYDEHMAWTVATNKRLGAKRCSPELGFSSSCWNMPQGPT